MKGWVTWTGCGVLFISLVLHIIIAEIVDVAGVLFDIGLIIMVIGLGRKVEKQLSSSSLG
jgi:hypothetical protein